MPNRNPLIEIPRASDAPSTPSRSSRARRSGAAWLAPAFLALFAACTPAEFSGDTEGVTGGSGTGGGTGTGGGGGSGGSGASQAESIAAFEQTAYPLLTQYCVACHAGSGPGFPSISSSNSTVAHGAVVDTQKVNFGNPGNSRLVQRLVADFHHCWSGDCNADGAMMAAAISQWATLINYGSGGQQSNGAIQSETLTFADGVEDQGQARVENGVIAKWEFKEGSGSVANDTSGVAPAIPLFASGDFRWMSNYGLDFTRGKAESPNAAMTRKLYDRIANPASGSQQFSLEAWVIPANTTQEGPARIATYSNGGAANFMLGQVMYYYNVRTRAAVEGNQSNGTPGLQTYDEDLQDTLQHVVVTYDVFRGRRIYVNGVFTDDVDEQGGGPLSNWDPNQVLTLANSRFGDRPWQGRVQLAAIYERALTDAEIQTNFLAGIGRRFLMTFDLSQYAPGTSLRFVVREFDDYSYLFCEPTLTTTNPSGFRISNIRIAINGQISVSGQAFTHVDQPITQSQMRLSELCSIIPKGPQGVAGDSIALDFEFLGSYTNPIVENNPPAPPPVDDTELRPTLGLRDFDRINATFAALTGVNPVTTPSVAAAFTALQQQLPSANDLRTFLATHQVGISNLSIEYCDALVDTPALRSGVFGSFNFDAAQTDFSQQTTRDALTVPLVSRLYGTNLSEQPSHAEVAGTLDSLVLTLAAPCTNGTTCDAARTQTIGKAVCDAVLTSAAVSIH
jgi:hypothetical protein